MIAVHNEAQRRHHVIHVDDLDWRAFAPNTEPTMTGEQPGEEVVGTCAQHRRGPQHRDRDLRMIALPLIDQSFSLRGMDRGSKAGIGSQRRVLGEWHRVGGPRAVHGGGRHPHELRDPDLGRGGQYPAGPFDVRTRHERIVDDRVDHRGKMHNGIDAREERFDLLAGHINEVGLETGTAPRRIAHIQTHDATHARAGQLGDQT